MISQIYVQFIDIIRP